MQKGSSFGITLRTVLRGLQLVLQKRSSLLWVLLGCQNQSAHQLALIHHQTWHPSSVMISWGRLQDLGAEVLKPMTGTFQITLCIYPGSLTTSVSLPRVSAHRMALLRLALGFGSENLFRLDTALTTADTTLLQTGEIATVAPVEIMSDVTLRNDHKASRS